MTSHTDNKEILEKAITKAIKGGWNLAKNNPELVDGEWEEWDFGWHFCLSTSDKKKAAHLYLSNYEIIFNHEFAKALWGEHDIHPALEDLPELKYIAWKYHLQQLVVADDIFKYLEENL